MNLRDDKVMTDSTIARIKSITTSNSQQQIQLLELQKEFLHTPFLTQRIVKRESKILPERRVILS